MKAKDVVALVKQTITEYKEDNVGRLSAALSYYTVFSIAPVLVIVVGVMGFVLGSRADIRQQLMLQLQNLIGNKDAVSLIGDMISGQQNIGASIWTTVLGIATLIFGATGLFIQLQSALNTIWEVIEKPGRGILVVIKDRFLSFTLILGIGFLLLVSLVLSAAIEVIGNYASNLLPGSTLLMQLLNNTLSFAVITLLFALIFKILPDAKIAWKDVWPGAAITSLLFVIGKWAIGLYLGTRGFSDAYGTAGALIILLLWVYYSSQILFLGAEFTQVYARNVGRGIAPEEGAIPIPESVRLQQGMTRSETAGGVIEQDKHEEPLPRPRHPVSGRQPELLPPTEPSLLAFSGIVMTLIGFLGGWVMNRGKRRR